jgi:hypothetical protein
MVTYLVIADWEIFEKFLYAEFDPYSIQAIGILHRGDEIYVRSYSGKFLNRIREKFEMQLCDLPDRFTLPKGWEFFGNAILFDL